MNCDDGLWRSSSYFFGGDRGYFFGSGVSLVRVRSELMVGEGRSGEKFRKAALASGRNLGRSVGSGKQELPKLPSYRSSVLGTSS